MLNRSLSILVLASAASLCTVAWAQNVNSSIVGTIRDATGANVPAASVTITNDGTNVETKVQANAAGDYTAPVLPAGNYTVKVEAAGFRSAVAKGIILLANRAFRQDFTLEVGQVQQSIEVAATAPVINSESATIGNVMQTQQITSVPLNGRFLDRLIRISAGVTTDSASNPRVAGSSYWGGMNFNVDGAAFNDPGNGGGAYSYLHGMSTLPSVDAVSEFKIDSNSMKPEFEGAASVTIATKSGTNELHGTLFYFNRNKATAARNFFSPTRPPFNRNEYGFMLGGPIVKNKTFAFGGYEMLKERAPSTYTLSVPTAAMRAGNFAGLATLIDPLSGNPFPGNVIPTNRIDPRSATMIGRVPLPNQAGTANGSLNNFIEVRNRRVSDIGRYFIRVDHRLTDKDTLWFSGSISKANPYFVPQGYPAEYGQWGNGGNDTRLGSLTWNRTFTPTILNEARFSYTYHGPVRQGINLDFDPRTLFPQLYGPLPLGGYPNMNITGYAAMGDYGGSERGKQLTRQFTDNLSIIRGKHTFKTGVDFGNFRMSSPPGAFGLGTGLANNAAFGRFDFSGRYTQEGTTAAPANAFADFLLGYPGFAYRSTPTAVNLFYNTRYSFYAQDDWQISSKFTLTYGVRYMVQTPWRERDLAQANFDFATGRLVIPRSTLPPQAQKRLFDAYPIALDPNFQILKTDKNNWQPRVGFAYRPFNNNKTVVRGGFGMFSNFLPVFIGFRQMGFSNPPFLLAETFEAAAGRTPTISLANPFPGGGAVSPNPSITIVDPSIKNSISNQWNLTFEREIVPTVGFRVSYVGNKTSNLPFYNYNANLPLTQVSGALQARRPYQPWSDILMLKGAGDSTIHQLQLEAIKRFSHGLSFQLEYSWNRSLDNTPVVGFGQDPYNHSLDRGNSDQIRRHIFTAAYTYELPFGKGKPMLNSLGSVGGKVVSGWALSGITYLRTGQPFSVSFSPSLPGWIANRANVTNVGNLSRSERTIDRWFDPSGYSIPAPFTYGNSARNLLFGPGDIVFDLSVLKDTPINERVKLQLRFEFFNIPNHPNFGNPGTNISVPATVGKITSAGDPRQIQFGAKVIF
ncbi:MAG: TonB-dependent receptor [Bryobacterales bacterium]|nr:TonB-dependent receptor [Bryobacterales bacterium]